MVSSIDRKLTVVAVAIGIVVWFAMSNGLTPPASNAPAGLVGINPGALDTLRIPIVFAVPIVVAYAALIYAALKRAGVVFAAVLLAAAAAGIATGQWLLVVVVVALVSTLVVLSGGNNGRRHVAGSD